MTGELSGPRACPAATAWPRRLPLPQEVTALAGPPALQSEKGRRCHKWRQPDLCGPRSCSVCALLGLAPS